ncbi:hypothetical protein B0H15DRAFT_949077 [Mycena belliarum]|uniref:Uncharacterized protein n=1 Tax=Mycena belliarum TaxID=1033014 RepID=A0AAD6XRH8_9AGAR|nr:hypothetical protein B0H15DRAFT_949077 [Mycena belliae]
MVAVNPRFTFLALSLASLSLPPAAEAAAIRPSDQGSPSKPSRQHPRAIPMPMKRSYEARAAEVKTFSKRQEGQARFSVKSRVDRRADAPPQVPSSTPGHVDITSPTNSTSGETGSTTIGHLLLNSTATPYVLDASERNMTTVFMVPSPSDSSRCTLQLSLFDAAKNATSQYCATFDPNPPAPEPLTMTPCFNASTTTPHTSQTFSYNSTSGVIQPMWYNGEDDGKTDDSSSSPSTVNDEEVNDSDADASENLDARDAPKPQDVILVFVSNAAADDVSQQDFPSSSDSTSASASGTSTTASATPSSASVGQSSSSSGVSSQASQSASFPSDRFVSAIPSATPSASSSFAAANVEAVSSSTTDVSTQSTVASTGLSSVSVSYSGASATPSFAAAEMNPSQSSMSASAMSTASAMSSVSSGFGAASSQSSSTVLPSQSPVSSSSASATSSDASSTVGALDVQLAAASSDSSVPASSSYSSVPSPSASTVAPASSSVDPAAIAAEVASSSASSSASYSSFSASPSSAAPSPSSSDSTVVSPPTSDSQAVYVGGSNERPVARAEMTPVSTAPYKLMFRAEPRL